MASINYATREISCKIVYYGPGLSGKTTNLQIIHRKIPVEAKSEMVSLATETDRTLFFDFLPLDLGSIKGFATKFQLYTVPGQVYYNATRKLVLRGVDGVVFVADSQRDKMQENVDSLKNLQENLKEYGIDLGAVPFVLQYNKRDLPGIATITELDQHLNWFKVPSYEAQAHQGVGVFTTLKAIGKIVIDTFNAKYSARQSSRRPSNSDASHSAASQVSQTSTLPVPPSPRSAAPLSSVPQAPAPRPVPTTPPPFLAPLSRPLPPAAPAPSAPLAPALPSASAPLPPLSAPTIPPAPSIPLPIPTLPPSAPLPVAQASHPAPNDLPQPLGLSGGLQGGQQLPGLSGGLQTGFFVPSQAPHTVQALPGLVEPPRPSHSAPIQLAPGLVETPQATRSSVVEALPGLQTNYVAPVAPTPPPASPPPSAPEASKKKGRLDGTLDPSDLDAEIARYERELAEQKAQQASTGRIVNTPNVNPNIDGADALASAFLTPEELSRLQGQDSFPTRRMPLGPGQP